MSSTIERSHGGAHEANTQNTASHRFAYRLYPSKEFCVVEVIIELHFSYEDARLRLRNACFDHFGGVTYIISSHITAHECRTSSGHAAAIQLGVRGHTYTLSTPKHIYTHTYTYAPHEVLCRFLHDRTNLAQRP